MKPKKPLPGAQTKKPTLPWWYFGLLVCVMGIAVFLRLWYLDRIPTGVVMDEFDYLLNAKFVYHTGTNIFANWSPWSLKTFPNEVPKGELTYLVSLPFVGPFGLSIFTARIGFAVISILSVGVTYAIAASLLGPWVGLIAGFMTAINPWSVYFGRTAYDVPVSITFYLIAFLCMLRLRGAKILLTLIPLFFAFYGYIGTKLILIPFVFVSAGYIWHFLRGRQDTKWFILLCLGTILIFGHFLLSVQSSTANLRMNQLYTPFDAKVAQEVDTERRLTLASPLTKLFANKPVVYVKNVIIKYFGAFSPAILFTNGEGVATFALWEHGLFYPLDALFLITGILLLFARTPPLLGLLFLLVSIATLPSVLSTEGTSYVHRSSLMYPFLTLLIAYGIYGSVQWLSANLKKAAVVVVIFLYVAATANFVYLYFFRFPYYNSESFGFSQRTYSRYTELARASGIRVVNITETPQLYFRNYLFYSDKLNANTVKPIRSAFLAETYAWENASFTKSCPTKADIDKGDTVYILSNTSPCKELFIRRPMTAIPSLADGGTLYMIFNDRVCRNYALSSYPTGFTMQDFAVENLSERQFCERFIVRYTNELYQPQTREGNWITQ